MMMTMFTAMVVVILQRSVLAQSSVSFTSTTSAVASTVTAPDSTITTTTTTTTSFNVTTTEYDPFVTTQAVNYTTECDETNACKPSDNWCMDVPFHSCNFNELLPGCRCLDLDGHSLAGSIPAAVWGIPNLLGLKISNNQLTGPLIQGGDAALLAAAENLSSSLLFLDVNHNTMTGAVPNSLGSLVTLESVDLSFNQFSGTLPRSLGFLLDARLVLVDHNRLNGTLPGRLVNLGVFGELWQLDVSSNQLTGALPPLVNWTQWQVDGIDAPLGFLSAAHNRLSSFDSSWCGLTKDFVCSLEGNLLRTGSDCSAAKAAAWKSACLFLDACGALSTEDILHLANSSCQAPQYAHGETCELVCEDGYGVGTFSSATDSSAVPRDVLDVVNCVDGSWQTTNVWGSQRSCVPLGCAPPTQSDVPGIVAGLRRCSGLTHGESCSVQCAPGYRLHEANKSDPTTQDIVCRFGKWETATPGTECRYVRGHTSTCPGIGSNVMRHSDYTACQGTNFTRFTVGGSEDLRLCDYECEKGFHKFEAFPEYFAESLSANPDVNLTEVLEELDVIANVAICRAPGYWEFNAPHIAGCFALPCESFWSDWSSCSRKCNYSYVEVSASGQSMSSSDNLSVATALGTQSRKFANLAEAASTKQLLDELAASRCSTSPGTVASRNCPATSYADCIGLSCNDILEAHEDNWTEWSGTCGLCSWWSTVLTIERSYSPRNQTYLTQAQEVCPQYVTQTKVCEEEYGEGGCYAALLLLLIPFVATGLSVFAVRQSQLRAMEDDMVASRLGKRCLVVQQRDHKQAFALYREVVTLRRWFSNDERLELLEQLPSPFAEPRPLFAEIRSYTAHCRGRPTLLEAYYYARLALEETSMNALQRVLFQECQGCQDDLSDLMTLVNEYTEDAEANSAIVGLHPLMLAVQWPWRDEQVQVGAVQQLLRRWGSHGSASQNSKGIGSTTMYVTIAAQAMTQRSHASVMDAIFEDCPAAFQPLGGEEMLQWLASVLAKGVNFASTDAPPASGAVGREAVATFMRILQKRLLEEQLAHPNCAPRTTSESQPEPTPSEDAELFVPAGTKANVAQAILKRLTKTYVCLQRERPRNTVSSSGTPGTLALRGDLEAGTVPGPPVRLMSSAAKVHPQPQPLSRSSVHDSKLIHDQEAQTKQLQASGPRANANGQNPNPKQLDDDDEPMSDVEIFQLELLLKPVMGAVRTFLEREIRQADVNFLERVAPCFTQGFKSIYDAVYQRFITSDPMSEKVKALADSMNADPLVADRRRSCVQRSSELLDVYNDAIAVLPMYCTFMSGVLQLTKAGDGSGAAPLKSLYRLLEKTGFREDGNQWSCNRVFDIVRGALIFKNMAGVLRCLEEFQQRQQNGEISIVRIKNRFAGETLGGWRDCMVNFYFNDDPTRHVCEAQVIHKSLMTARKGMAGHSDYTAYRCATEISTFLREEAARSGSSSSSKTAANNSSNNINRSAAAAR